MTHPPPWSSPILRWRRGLFVAGGGLKSSASIHSEPTAEENFYSVKIEENFATKDEKRVTLPSGAAKKKGGNFGGI